ncbi:kinetochore Sim4 complex subunit FTA2-domain-containing protein [Astrocystis sublimbata]|nr:kinetochore Sim4 complex subunit FTA2-domain-containing protein [Astrocystis sublimbata]
MSSDRESTASSSVELEPDYINEHLLSASETPPCEGPKLQVFPCKAEEIEWLECLYGDASLFEYRSCQVWKVKIRSRVYALKVFNPFHPGTCRLGQSRATNAKITDATLSYHEDPFYVECRAYAKLQQACQTKRMWKHVARCYGWIALPIEKGADDGFLAQLRDLLWDQSTNEPDVRRFPYLLRFTQGTPIRAILKEYVERDAAFTTAGLKRMLRGLKYMHKQEVFNLDIHRMNYRNEMLIDFEQFQDMVDEEGFGLEVRAMPSLERMESLRPRKVKDVDEKDVDEKDVDEKDVDEKDVDEKDVDEKDVDEKDVDETGDVRNHLRRPSQ